MKLNNTSIVSLLIIISIGIFTSCSSEESIPTMEPGSYERIYNIESTIGENSATTRQITSDRFTNDYDADAIYIHSLSGKSRVVKYYVRTDLPNCPDCKGIRVTYTISEDGLVTLVGDDDNKATFSLTEKVYLSSIAEENWTHTPCGTTPVKQSPVLSRDENINKELYRSAVDHPITDFLQGTGGCERGILMDRTCTAFRVYFLFSKLHEGVTDPGGNTIFPYPTTEDLQQIGITDIQSLASKVYLGPMFCTSFNVRTKKAEGNNNDVFYATNNNQYQAFEYITVGDNDYGQGKKIEYKGWGIQSPLGYLITPYNQDHTGGYHFYAFVKNGNDNPSSDEGSLYTEYTIDTTTDGALDFNQCEIVIIVYDYSQLEVFAQEAASNDATTRNYWKTPQKIDLKPAKVIRIIE